MSESLTDWAAVVLAGGLGTRIRHLHPDVPKPMIPVCGRPFVEWIARYLSCQGCRQIVLSAGHLSTVVESHFKSQPVPGARVMCVPEPQPLGTAGGFLNAAENSGIHPKGWLVLNGDSLVFGDLSIAMNRLRSTEADGAFVGVRVPDAGRFGTLEIAPDGRLLGFAEKRPGAGVINAGIYFFRARLLREAPSQRPLSFEKDVFPGWLAKGRNFQVVEASPPFLDIGTPESLALAEEFISGNQQWFGPPQ
jgi:D-glycero-alpha-D-manno-heptose 1-phosphate guanylyltransferase